MKFIIIFSHKQKGKKRWKINMRLYYYTITPMTLMWMPLYTAYTHTQFTAAGGHGLGGVLWIPK